MCPGVRRPQLNKLLLYPAGFYFYLIASNLVLRFTWTYKLTGLFRANWAIMLFTLLEAFRCVIAAWRAQSYQRPGQTVLSLHLVYRKTCSMQRSQQMQ